MAAANGAGAAAMVGATRGGGAAAMEGGATAAAASFALRRSLIAALVSALRFALSYDGRGSKEPSALATASDLVFAYSIRWRGGPRQRVRGAPQQGADQRLLVELETFHERLRLRRLLRGGEHNPRLAAQLVRLAQHNVQHRAELGEDDAQALAQLWIAEVSWGRRPRAPFCCQTHLLSVVFPRGCARTACRTRAPRRLHSLRALAHQRPFRWLPLQFEKLVAVQRAASRL